MVKILIPIVVIVVLVISPAQMPVVIAARTSLRTLLQINVNPSVPLDRVVMAIRDNIAVTEKMVQIIKL